MIVIGNEADTARPVAAPSYIIARDLLATCASEIRRQAAAMQSLDTALGAVLDMYRHAPSRKMDEKKHMTATLIADLQRADRLRQEVEGVARALDLLVAAESLATVIASDSVRDCTPLMDLQDRLLPQSCLAPGPITCVVAVP